MTVSSIESASCEIKHSGRTVFTFLNKTISFHVKYSKTIFIFFNSMFRITFLCHITIYQSKLENKFAETHFVFNME